MWSPPSVACEGLQGRLLSLRLLDSVDSGGSLDVSGEECHASGDQGNCGALYFLREGDSTQRLNQVDGDSGECGTDTGTNGGCNDLRLRCAGRAAVHVGRNRLRGFVDWCAHSSILPLPVGGRWVFSQVRNVHGAQVRPGGAGPLSHEGADNARCGGANAGFRL